MAKQTINIGTAPNDGTGEPLRGAMGKINANFNEVYAFTKADIGLANVDNTSDADKAISTATQAALDALQAKDATLTALAALAWSAGTQIPVFTAADTVSFLTVGQAAGNLLDKAAGDALYALTGHSHTKSDVGLGNVDNTSDANKPVSTAMQTALDGKQAQATNLTSLAGLTLTENATKRVSVNDAETGFDLVLDGAFKGGWSTGYAASSLGTGTGATGNLGLTANYTYGIAFQASQNGVIDTLNVIGSSAGASASNFYMAIYAASAANSWSTRLGQTAIVVGLGQSETKSIPLQSPVEIVAGNWYAIAILSQSGLNIRINGGGSCYYFSDSYADGPIATVTEQHVQGFAPIIWGTGAGNDGSYVYSDTATHSGKTWFCLKTGTTQTPTDAASEWKLMGPFTKTEVGLGNVDNTSDADKPISTATQDALDLKQNITFGFGAFMSGLGEAAEVVSGYIAPGAFTISGANTSAKSTVAATAETIYAIKVEGASAGTITFAAAATTGTVSITSGAVASGNLVVIEGPATADATLANVAFRVSN